LIKALLEKVEADSEDSQAQSIAEVMFDTAVLRSGYQLKDQVDFSKRIMNMLYKNLDIDPNTPIEAEPEEEEEAEEEEEDDEEEEVDADEEDEAATEEGHDEL